jgi:Serine dehydrogenase proteinase
LAQVGGFTSRLLERHMDPERAREVANVLSQGALTHDHPLQHGELRTLGLPVRVGVPDEERELMTLYPPPRGRTQAVEYVPGPRAPELPIRRELPPRRG